MRSGGANYRDEARLEHMLRAVNRIIQQQQGLDRKMLREGDDKTEIVLYNIQQIGEDANNISEEVCEAHPEIDFKGWAGMRHRLVHDYANIDFDIVWNALMEDAPKLRDSLLPIVDALPKESLPDNIEEFE